MESAYFDMIISDIMMPVLDGYELVQILRGRDDAIQQQDRNAQEKTCLSRCFIIRGNYRHWQFSPLCSRESTSSPLMRRRAAFVRLSFDYFFFTVCTNSMLYITKASTENAAKVPHSIC